jgi:hypothetical protein
MAASFGMQVDDLEAARRQHLGDAAAVADSWVGLEAEEARGRFPGDRRGALEVVRGLRRRELAMPAASSEAASTFFENPARREFGRSRTSIRVLTPAASRASMKAAWVVFS